MCVQKLTHGLFYAFSFHDITQSSYFKDDGLQLYLQTSDVTKAAATGYNYTPTCSNNYHHQLNTLEKHTEHKKNQQNRQNHITGEKFWVERD